MQIYNNQGSRNCYKKNNKTVYHKTWLLSIFWVQKKTIVLATAYFCLAAIIGAERLDCCVRDGNRYDPLAHVTKKMVFFLRFKFLNNL